MFCFINVQFFSDIGGGPHALGVARMREQPDFVELSTIHCSISKPRTNSPKKSRRWSRTETQEPLRRCQVLRRPRLLPKRTLRRTLQRMLRRKLRRARRRKLRRTLPPKQRRRLEKRLKKLRRNGRSRQRGAARRNAALRPQDRGRPSPRRAARTPPRPASFFLMRN